MQRKQIPARPLHRTPITAESLRFLVLFMLMILALQVFALLLAGNVVRPEMILKATPQPLVRTHAVNEGWMGGHNISFIQRPSIKIPIIPRFKPTPWN